MVGKGCNVEVTWLLSADYPGAELGLEAAVVLAAAFDERKALTTSRILSEPGDD